MCNNPLMSDVTFDVTGRTFHGHKYVLATGSTVFYAMFYGGLSGNTNSSIAGAESKLPVVEVPDVDPEAFLTMLKYLYSDEIALNADNVLSTLYAAKKYIILHLAEECVRWDNSLNDQVVSDMLSSSYH